MYEGVLIYYLAILIDMLKIKVRKWPVYKSNVNQFSVLKFVLLLLCACVSTTTFADLRHYSADVEDSSWVITNNTRLTCELSHPIPGYGTASFISNASKNQNMVFLLDMQRLPSRYDRATVYSVPPVWARQNRQRSIGTIDLKTQFDPSAEDSTVWRMLTELEKGFWPTLYYQDWLNDIDSVAVALNASNFKQQYRQFNACIANLLPFNFEDIAYTVLTYKRESSELTKYSQRRLNMIGEYLKEDLELSLVLIDSYTDSYGGDWLNEQLSLERAESIREFFASMGIQNDRIEITAHGEKRHSNNNLDALQRHKNRRVVVRLSKS